VSEVTALKRGHVGHDIERHPGMVPPVLWPIYASYVERGRRQTVGSFQRTQNPPTAEPLATLAQFETRPFPVGDIPASDTRRFADHEVTIRLRWCRRLGRWVRANDLISVSLPSEQARSTAFGSHEFASRRVEQRRAHSVRYRSHQRNRTLAAADEERESIDVLVLAEADLHQVIGTLQHEPTGIGRVDVRSHLAYGRDHVVARAKRARLIVLREIVDASDAGRNSEREHVPTHRSMLPSMGSTRLAAAPRSRAYAHACGTEVARGRLGLRERGRHGTASAP
jgi:hypothetical protein